MTDARRERLMEIQKREQVKGLLINKFKLKYGSKPNISKYIDNEVQKFLANDRLNQDNLKALDDKIGKEAFNRDRKDAILDDRKSEGRPASVSGQSIRSRLSAHNLNKFDNDAASQGTRSVHSVRSKSAYQRSKGK